MSRLTKDGKILYKGSSWKVKFGDGVNPEAKLVFENINKALEKLSCLEDLEEALGCPLEVREQAFNNGFYDENGNHYICEHYVHYFKQMHTKGIMAHTEKRFRLKDYKKTWWLREDKSE